MKKIHNTDAFRVQLRLYGLLAIIITVAIIFLMPPSDDRRERLGKWINAIEILQAQAKVELMSPQCYFAKKAEISLKVLEDTAWAKDELEIAVDLACKNRVGKMGFFNTRISPELKNIRAGEKFIESRTQTLIEF